MSIEHITAENFDTLVIQSPKKVLLDFWATWCGPCQRIAPFVEAVAQAHPEVLVGKVDVDTDPSLAIRFGVSSIPTLLVLEQGKVTATLVGFQPQAAIEKLLEG